MLTNAMRTKLHQIAASLESGKEWDEALAIMGAHDPATVHRQEEQKEKNIAWLKGLTGEERAIEIKLNKEQSDKKKIAKQRAVKEATEELKTKLRYILSEAHIRGLTPIFTHFHIKKKVVDKFMDATFTREVKVLKGTTCMLVDKDGWVHGRGLSLASKQDVPSRLEGRLGAADRALSAILEETTGRPVTRPEGVEVAKEIMGALPDVGKDQESSAWSNKSIYLPDAGELSWIEKHRVRSRFQEPDETQTRSFAKMSE